MPNPIFSSLPTTIFEEMSGLARTLGAINLGQGFPDDPGPEAIRAKAADAVLNGYNPKASTSIRPAKSPSPPAPPRPWPPPSWALSSRATR
jgi:aspartate/methionine/tyrosine aminotransferase